MKEDDIYVFLRLVKKSIKKWSVPVVCHLGQQGSDPFRILIACILSSRTRDQTTAEAFERLLAISSDPYFNGKNRSKKNREGNFPSGVFSHKIQTNSGDESKNL